jgi:hypothetical protein
MRSRWPIGQLLRLEAHPHTCGLHTRYVENTLCSKFDTATHGSVTINATQEHQV